MKIIVGNYSGFCNGVKNAVNKTIEKLTGDDFYSVGEIVHNEEVIKDLEKRGLIVKNNIMDIPNNSKVIIRAHGEELSFYQEAKKKNLTVIDLTCGRVKIIHNKILNKKNSFVIIIGKKSHPETIAHKSYSEYAYIVEDLNDLKNLYEEYLKSNKESIYIVSQTTFNASFFDQLVDEIKRIFNDVKIEVDKTICNATSIRQMEAREIAKAVDKMIVIGGKNSSNTRELAVETGKYCQVVYLIQTKNDLHENMFNDNDIIGITAGASTPDKVINDVIEYVRGLYKKVK